MGASTVYQFQGYDVCCKRKNDTVTQSSSCFWFQLFKIICFLFISKICIAVYNGRCFLLTEFRSVLSSDKPNAVIEGLSVNLGCRSCCIHMLDYTHCLRILHSKLMFNFPGTIYRTPSHNIVFYDMCRNLFFFENHFLLYILYSGRPTCTLNNIVKRRPFGFFVCGRIN